MDLTAHHQAIHLRKVLEGAVDSCRQLRDVVGLQDQLQAKKEGREKRQEKKKKKEKILS